MSIIGVADVEAASGNLTIGPRDVLTPLARDRAAELGIAVVRSDSQPAAQGPAAGATGRPVTALAGASGAPRAADAATTNGLYRRGAPPEPAMRPGTAAGTARPGGGGRRPRVAVIGAGHVGSITTLRLAESDLFAEVILVDVVPDLAAGIALDLWHSAGLARFSTLVKGAESLAAAADVEYVVMTAGKPRKPGMTRTDLTAANAAIVSPVAKEIARVAPKSVIVVVTNPLEEMTHLAQRSSGFPPERVLGMAGVLDSARFCALVGLTGVAAPHDVHAYALGSHGPEMVIPLSQATVSGRPIGEVVATDALAAIVERTRDSGAEVVKLLQSGSAYFAPGQSAALMVITMASGADTVLPCAVEPAGSYGLRGTRVGLPVRLGPKGLREVVELELTEPERSALSEAADRLRERLREVA